MILWISASMPTGTCRPVSTGCRSTTSSRPSPRGRPGANGWARLREIVSLAAASGLIRRVYICGSFVTAKANPRDLDILLVLRPEWGGDEPPHPLGTVLNHEQARLRFQADVFWVPEDVGEVVIADLLDAFMVDRDKRQRGIVEVAL